MKILKIVILLIATAGVLVGTYFFGLKGGSNLVRNGIMANYPTVKNVVQSADVEIDSALNFSIKPEDDSLLYGLIKENSKGDSLQISIPFYVRYGVDLSVRNFRVFKDDKGDAEVWLPAVTLRYCELKFDRMIVNGKPATGTAAAHKALYDYLIPRFEKNRKNQEAAKLNVTRAMMYYFMPYKFGLTLYIGDEQQSLPLLPGVNQTVDDAVKEAYSNK